MTCWTTSVINLTWLTTTLAASTVADIWIPSTGVPAYRPSTSWVVSLLTNLTCTMDVVIEMTISESSCLAASCLVLHPHPLRVSFLCNYILLAVPTKALGYEALEWIVDFEDYYQNHWNIPMTFSASKFVWVSHWKGGNVHVMEELIAVEALEGSKNVLLSTSMIRESQLERPLTVINGMHLVSKTKPPWGTVEIMLLFDKAHRLTKSTNKRTLSKRISHKKRPFGLTIMNEEQGYWISS
ncbi:hypothetical protein SELMODRAFT_405570 [Selaginella moellendorffii]|uniref:Uncharacterized protein n=1 Tax=Selaginella moellendorffii TaxID=88036 RepID=D8QZ07_SELML|nr:hypothetical protein SELMODRAFT_405570 [Selaginella moellendorffii]